MRMLIAVDLAHNSEAVIEAAAELAMSLSASVCILHAVEPDPDFVGYEVGPQTRRDAVAETFHEEHRQVQNLAGHFRQAELDAVGLLVQGPTVETILREAEKFKADLIVVGSHGKGQLKQLVLGSVSEGVLRKSACPVVVIPIRTR